MFWVLFYFICSLFWNPVCRATWVSACRLWVSFPGPVETYWPECGSLENKSLMTFSVDRNWYWDYVCCGISSVERFEVWIARRLILRSEHVDSYSKSRPRGGVHLKKAPTSQKLYCLSFRNISLVNDIKGNNDHFFWEQNETPEDSRWCPVSDVSCHCYKAGQWPWEATQWNEVQNFGA